MPRLGLFEIWRRGATFTCQCFMCGIYVDFVAQTTSFSQKSVPFSVQRLNLYGQIDGVLTLSEGSVHGMSTNEMSLYQHQPFH